MIPIDFFYTEKMTVSDTFICIKGSKLFPKGADTIAEFIFAPINSNVSEKSGNSF